MPFCPARMFYNLEATKLKDIFALMVVVNEGKEDMHASKSHIILLMLCCIRSAKLEINIKSTKIIKDECRDGLKRYIHKGY